PVSPFAACGSGLLLTNDGRFNLLTRQIWLKIVSCREYRKWGGAYGVCITHWRTCCPKRDHCNHVNEIDHCLYPAAPFAECAGLRLAKNALTSRNSL